jgi:hypothetical protein
MNVTCVAYMKFHFVSNKRIFKSFIQIHTLANEVNAQRNLISLLKIQLYLQVEAVYVKFDNSALFKRKQLMSVRSAN